MSLPGGPSDKIGNRYELWWTVSQFVRIINGEADSIRIEDPTIDKAEFVITAGGCREFHQVKRSHLRGKWSLSELGSPKHQLLQAMFNQLSTSIDTRFVFVSGSEARELEELTKRAADAKDLKEFELEFVCAKSQKQNFNRLKGVWNTDTATAYEILRRIKVETANEEWISKYVRDSLSALFLTKPDNVCDALRSFAQDSISTTSGRSSDFFDVVEDLLDEVRGFRNSVKFHVVVVCRKFDWENDHCFRPLRKDCVEVSVIDFSMDEVKSVIESGGFKADLFNAKQLELLCLPQNLSLFLDTNYDLGSRPTFLTQKDLFVRYWKEKRQAVKDRIDSPSDHWTDVIQVLCGKMTESQQLSVLEGTLDKFPSDYLDAMVSEGVLSFDQNRYGFGHEAFFDYCFARGFVAKDESLTEFLTKSEQHLFRRAQVLQVLIYLRDADRERYCKELRALLTDTAIRCHLKDLAVAVAVEMPNPEESEWNILAPWIESELEAIKTGKPNPDKFASLVWNRFSTSQPWFQIADAKGLVGDWLTSENDHLVDTGVNYVYYHLEQSFDKLAALLEPFVGRGGGWPQRFQSVMYRADLRSSRRYFELFLRLIDDGTLDDDDSNDNTFWYNLDSLADEHADWIPEALSHWLLRRLSVIQEACPSGEVPNWQDLFEHHNSGLKNIHEFANQFPDKFAQHVLPVILKISDDAAYDKVPPKQGHMFSMSAFNSEYFSIEDACRYAVALAVEKLAESNSGLIAEILADLRNHTTYMSNFLLLRVYTAGAKHFADDAVSELCDKSWRFRCGYSDSPYSVAIQLIKAIAPFCSDENRAKLEKVILDYTPYNERSPGGHRYRGQASFALLSGIPVEWRSKTAQARYAELKRKFLKPISPPRKHGMFMTTVASPIEEAAAEKMTDEQWLKAIKKYDLWENRSDPSKGGAWELGSMFRRFLIKDSDRFARLSLRFPLGTNPTYIEDTLYGLRATEACTKLKLDVCRKAYSESCDECGRAIAGLLGSIKEPLPNDAVQMLSWLATKHPDSQRDLWREKNTDGAPAYGGDILHRGINTTRGCAARSIGSLILSDASYIDRFRATIEQLVNDRSLAVRACAGFTLLKIINHDPKFALEQFAKLIEPQGEQTNSDHLLVTRDVKRFIFDEIRDHFECLRKVVERMLRSEFSEISEAGAQCASLAALYHHDNAENLVAEAVRGNASQRRGVAQVASENIGREDCRSWAEQKLMLLFNDCDSEVCEEAARCFDTLEGQSFESYEDLINKFCGSAAFQENSSSILYALEKSSHQLPGITYSVCEKFLKWFTDANDIRKSRSADSSVAKLILRIYHQHQRDEWAPKCLDLIDQMCLARMYYVGQGLREYER